MVRAQELSATGCWHLLFHQRMMKMSHYQPGSHKQCKMDTAAAWQGRETVLRLVAVIQWLC